MLLSLAAAAPALALPTMVRLGYPNCASCHISPQGGGPLDVYGRGIDEAQSRRAGEYKPAEPDPRVLNLWGRMTQDVRTVIREQETWATNKPAANLFRPRLMYRNVTELGKGFRVSGVVSAESEHVLRPARRYEPAADASSVFVGTALLHYRIGGSAEIAVGRDQLPTGINIPDQGIVIKARNRMGYYDVPTQVKLVVTGKRFQVAPFLFAPAATIRPARPRRARAQSASSTCSARGGRSSVRRPRMASTTTVVVACWVATHGWGSDRGASSPNTT